MATKIYIKHGTGAPDAADISGPGELAIDVQNKIIYTKDNNDQMIALGADVTSSVIDWSQLENVPTEFPPSDHEHDYTEINDGNGTALNVEIDAINAALGELQSAVDSLEGNLAYGGTVDGSLGTITSATAAATDKGFAVGNVPAPPPAGSEGVYFIAEKAGTIDGHVLSSGDWLVSEGDAGWTDVNFDATISVTWDEIGGKPTEFPPSDHTHTIDEITDLQDELDGLAVADHTHEIDDITGLQEALDLKASVLSISGGTY